MPRPSALFSKLTSDRELSIRGILLGAFITIIFTAANVYLGLKLGLTFASSIPAAIISMTVLRLLGGGTVLENNMVQTQASAAGTLSCVFAALPGLILIGWWQDFPYIQSFLLTMAGGMTGVLFTIPLRRTLVNESDLPYPEGRACAEILHASSPEGDRHNLHLLSLSGVISAIVSFASSGLNLLTSGFSFAGKIGASAFGISGSFSLALLGTGYLVGLSGGIAILLGVLLAWDVFIPILGALSASPNPIEEATHIWRTKVRFIGAGVIAIAALWTLLQLAQPVFKGIQRSFSRTLHISLNETERDLSPRTMLSLAILLACILEALFISFLLPTHLSWPFLLLLSTGGTLICFTLGFIVASACGYMAGIVGSSSSPISGIGIIAIIVISAIACSLESSGILPATFRPALVAFSLFLLSAITASAAVSNDNLQDLKTGQLLGATPWKQETALLIGCAVGALVIPWLLHIIYHAYGLAGHLPRPEMNPSNALPAPQPALMADLAKGIITHALDWDMLKIGAILGLMLIIIDVALKKFDRALPPLAIGMGLYLPPDVSITVAIGAALGGLMQHKPSTKGTMIASGLIVGESIMGIILAAISSLTGTTSSLSLPIYAPLQTILGWSIFISVATWFTLQLRQTKT